MEYKFSKNVDFPKIELLIESFYELTGVSCLIEYNNGFIDTFSEIIPCSEFRLKNYDDNIKKQIRNKNRYGVVKSKSGLMYLGIPVFVESTIEAVIFTSPVFYKEPDWNYLKDEIESVHSNIMDAKKYVEKIPTIDSKKIKKILEFIFSIVHIIEKMMTDNRKKTNDYEKLKRNYCKISSACKLLKTQYKNISKMAYYDELTGLPNFNYLKINLEHRIKINIKKNFVLFNIDLDNFKNVNDIFGYKHGDKLLKKIGDSIRSMYSEKDIVARHGGNEFLILSERENLDKIDEEAENLLNFLSGLWSWNGKEVPISVSIGISIYSNNSDASDLLRKADMALDKAKSSGKNSYRIFEKSMYDEIFRKSELEKDMRKAIKNNEFLLYYQPQVDVSTSKIVSFEALIRWKNPQKGWIMPNEFIGLAEETSLIIPIGEWVFREACLQSIYWKNKGYNYDFISINVSPVQLRRNGFLDMVKRIIKETGVDTSSIEVEITESAVMESLDKSILIINELRKLGIKVAMDDFGSGYSSLNYLKSIPINTIKIDKTFIDGICKYTYENIITEGIINLAHKMELDVIAEGVEFEEQFTILKMKSCNKIQGYYFGKPMSVNEIDGIFQKSKERCI